MRMGTNADGQKKEPYMDTVKKFFKDKMPDMTVHVGETTALKHGSIMQHRERVWVRALRTTVLLGRPFPPILVTAELVPNWVRNNDAFDYLNLKLPNQWPQSTGQQKNLLWQERRAVGQIKALTQGGRSFEEAGVGKVLMFDVTRGADSVFDPTSFSNGQCPALTTRNYNIWIMSTVDLGRDDIPLMQRLVCRSLHVGERFLLMGHRADSARHFGKSAAIHVAGNAFPVHQGFAVSIAMLYQISEHLSHCRERSSSSTKRARR